MAPKVFNNVHCVKDCSGILFRGFCYPFGGWGDKNLLKRYSGKPARTPKKLNKKHPQPRPLTETTDPGGTIKNTYYANGNLKTADYGGTVQSIEYDGWGRKTKLTDPSAGVYTYAYNDFGETTRETTPKGRTVYIYDASGKLKTKRVQGDATNLTYSYTYSPNTKLLTNISFTSADGNNTTYTYTYDSKFRPETTIESNPYATFTKGFTYDNFGRLKTETSVALNKANGKQGYSTVSNNYQNGQLLNIMHNDTGTKIWEVTAVNARGQVTAANLGPRSRKC